MPKVCYARAGFLASHFQASERNGYAKQCLYPNECRKHAFYFQENERNESALSFSNERRKQALLTSRPECSVSSAARMNGQMSMLAEPKPYLAKHPRCQLANTPYVCIGYGTDGVFYITSGAVIPSTLRPFLSVSRTASVSKTLYGACSSELSAIRSCA